MTVVIDLSTGKTVKARKVKTRYGHRWCVRDGAVWLPVAPERRDAQAKHGFVEAAAPWLVVGREALVPLGCPMPSFARRGRHRRASKTPYVGRHGRHDRSNPHSRSLSW